MIPKSGGATPKPHRIDAYGVNTVKVKPHVTFIVEPEA